VPTKKLVVVATIILSALVVCQATSLNQSITIPSSGSILVTQSTGAKSQIRSTSFGESDGQNANWTLIASTCASYGINQVCIDSVRNYIVTVQGTWPVPSLGYLNLTWAVSAFHSYGIKVFAGMDPMFKSYSGDGINRDSYIIPYNGNLSQLETYTAENGYGWLDIANPASVTLLHKLVNQLVSNYSIDGMTFDYLRWDGYLMPYGNYDMQQFQYDTGLDVGVSYSQWLQDVVPVDYPYTSTPTGGNGKYYAQFMEWRNNLVTTLLQNITQWALAINPNLKFGCTPHALVFSSRPEPDYYTFRDGQDPANWIRLGLIQWIAPMMYPNSNSTSDLAAFLNSLPGLMQNEENYNTGGPHGVIPIVPTLTSGGPEFNNGNTYTTGDFTSWVSSLVANGADGFNIAYQTGPGSASQAAGPSVVSYLAALGLPNPPTFALTNITVTVSGSSATVQWKTTLPANSLIIYNTPTAIYTWSQKNATDMLSSGFPYWQCSLPSGTIVSNSTLNTNHVFILTGLTASSYVFQVRSTDPSGTAFSTQQTFTV